MGFPGRALVNICLQWLRSTGDVGELVIPLVCQLGYKANRPGCLNSVPHTAGCRHGHVSTQTPQSSTQAPQIAPNPLRAVPRPPTLQLMEGGAAAHVPIPVSAPVHLCHEPGALRDTGWEGNVGTEGAAGCLGQQWATKNTAGSCSFSKLLGGRISPAGPKGPINHTDKSQPVYLRGGQTRLIQMSALSPPRWWCTSTIPPSQW